MDRQLSYALINADTAPVEPGIGGAGMPLAISGRQDSATSAGRWIVPAGGSTGWYKLENCAAMLILLEGDGQFDFGDGEIAVRPGHCIHIAAGTPHSFTSAPGRPAVLVGFLINASSWRETGYVPLDAPEKASAGYLDIHLDDVAPERMARSDGWQITDFRLPLGGHNGIGSTLFRARFFPGAVHAKHRHDACDEIYYIISGRGLAGAGPDRVEVTSGDFHFIPRGVEHWLHNLSDDDPIEVVGTYIGAASVAETGYVFMGEVTGADLTARTM